MSCKEGGMVEKKRQREREGYGAECVGAEQVSGTLGYGNYELHRLESDIDILFQ